MENENLETTTTEVEETAQAPAGENQEKEKSFTQKEVDELIEKRLTRERKKMERESKKEEESKKEIDENETIRTLRETIKKQNERILKNEAKEIAKTLNVDTDFIDAVISLSDFSQIDLENNDFDSDEIKEALQNVIDKYPRFLAAKKTETEEVNKGFVKVGTPSTEQPSTTKTLDQIKKSMGL